MRIVLACVHGTNFIPPTYRKLFSKRGPKKLLDTHWGFDPGAIDVARYLQRRFKTKLHAFPVSRLLIEPDNYKPTKRWNILTESLSKQEKEKLLARYWQPFMDGIESDLKKSSQSLLIVSHSFTPVWKGEVRKCDVGILYDPKRSREAKFSLALQKALQRQLPGLIIRRNYPYTGYWEGTAGNFRERLPGTKYLGIEIEVNYKHIRQKTKTGEAIKRALADCLEELA